MTARGSTEAVLRHYARLARYYDRVWRGYLEQTHAATLNALDPARGARVLDVGCGTGLLLKALADASPDLDLHGVDASPEMLARARARLGDTATLTRGFADALPYGEEFDVVVSTSVLHCLPDPREGAIEEWVRVLRPGGALVITDWRADHPGTRTYVAALRLLGRQQYRPLTAAGLVLLLESSGLRVFRARTLQTEGWGLVSVRGAAPEAAP